MIYLENVHHMAKGTSAARFLIDRKWPRGVIRFIPHKEKSGQTHEALAPIIWRPKLAPGNLLSQWFYQTPDKDRFRRKYFRELLKNEKEWKPIVSVAMKQKIMILYHDEGLSLVAARAFKEFLELKLKSYGTLKSVHSRRRAPIGKGVVVPPIETVISRKLNLPLKPKKDFKIEEKKTFIASGKRKVLGG